MQNNLVKELPVEIGAPQQLYELKVQNNPLQTPPPEILSGGMAKFLQYFRVLYAGMEANNVMLHDFPIVEIPPELFTRPKL